ncbi:Tetraspanin family-domain-containing protein [Phycomyces nitens]|nr:Tetraspanin family-domain-containing protein [Phycomyces nitens]
MEARLMNSRSRGLRESTAYFHLVFMFVGLCVMAMGAYTINSSTSMTISLSLLLIGGIITVISFIGCFGAHLEHTGFLRTYSSATTIALIVQIALVGIIYCHRSQIDFYASSLWDFFNDNDTRFLVDFEQAFHCCGYGSIHDRAVPSTCGLSLDVDSGCKDTIVLLAGVWSEWLIGGLVVLLSLQLITLIIVLVLTVLMERDAKEEEMYLSLISRQNTNHSWFNGNGNGEGPSSGGSYFGRYPQSNWQRSSFHTPNNPPQRVPRYGTFTPTK